MSDKPGTDEHLDQLAKKLLKAREALTKAIDMADAPQDELLKFNDHGQWKLAKAMKPWRGGMFTSEHINNAASQKTHEGAVAEARKAVDSSNAREYNKRQAHHTLDNMKPHPQHKHLLSYMTNAGFAYNQKIKRRKQGVKDDE